MKIHREEAKGSYVTAVGKRMNPSCQVRTDDVVDSVFNFVKNHYIQNRSTSEDEAAIFNALTNGRCNIYDISW